MPERHKWSDLKAQMAPGQPERIAAQTAELLAMYPADEAGAVAPLRMMRESEDAPLSEYAAALGTDEAGALAFEECEDAPVSQVAAYIKAMGGRLKVVAEFPDCDDVIIANFYRKRRWPARSSKSMFGRFELIPHTAIGPTAYRQLEWAAQTCRRRLDGRYDNARRKVYAPKFRSALRSGCNGAVIEQLLGFVNGAGDAVSGITIAEALQASVPDAIATLRHLADADLRDVDGDGMSTWDSILARRAVERLMADEGVDVILASQILALANPALFVAWDAATQQTFFPHNDPDDGFAPVRYVRFVWKMADSARTVQQDAAVNYGIDDPAAHLCQELGIDPPVTLAGFISEYNRLTLAAGQEQSERRRLRRYAKQDAPVISRGQRGGAKMASGIVLPTTYRQILQAADDYNSGRDRYNDSYREVYSGAFRNNLAERCDEAHVGELVRFLNRWRCRLSWDKTPGILLLSVPETALHLNPVFGLELGNDNVDYATFDIAEKAFDRLIADKGIGATAASKILAVLNPGLFVAWDTLIQKAIYGHRKCNGREYAGFMRDMHKSAQAVNADALQQGIENPAASISQAINQYPPFTLAHFINNYVWLTVTRGHTYAPI